MKAVPFIILVETDDLVEVKEFMHKFLSLPAPKPIDGTKYSFVGFLSVPTPE